MEFDESGRVPRWFTMSPLPGPFDSPPPAVLVEVEFGAHSRRGPQRLANEDNYLVLRLGRHQDTLLTSLPSHAIAGRFEEFAYGMVIADGMGGDGEAASRLAITTLLHLIVYFGRWNVRIDEAIADEIMERAERFYRGVDSTLLQASQHSQLGLQSTLTAVVTAGKDLIFAHVGHSRAYLFRDGELQQLTRDHTLAAERQGKAGIVDVTPIARDLHHTLTETMGRTAPGGPRIDIERVALLDGDLVMLCTNGLTDVVDEAGIARVLQLYHTPAEQCRTLVDLAIDAGGKDDVTAVAAHFHIPTDRAAKQQ